MTYIISQKQEEGKIMRRTRAHQVFKKRCPIFGDSCNLVRDRLDVKEVMGKDSII